MQPESTGWYLYRFFTRLPCAVPGCQIRHPLYIGKSNDPLRRWLEHAPKQPWWSAQCGYEIDERVWPSDRAVREAETAAIHAELPLANIDGNERNRHRLDFRRAVPQQVVRGAYRPVAAVPVRRSWSPRQVKVAVLLALWAVLAVAVWVVAVGTFGASLAGGAEAGAVGATSLYVAAWRSGRPRGAGAGRIGWSPPAPIFGATPMHALAGLSPALSTPQPYYVTAIVAATVLAAGLWLRFISR